MPPSLTPVITEAIRRSPVYLSQCANYWLTREKCGIFASVCAVTVSVVLCTQVTVSWSAVFINNLSCYRILTVRSSSQHSFTCGWYIYVQISPDEENLKKKNKAQVSHLEKQRHKIIFLAFCLDISDYLSMWVMDLTGDTIPITNKMNFSSWH